MTSIKSETTTPAQARQLPDAKQDRERIVRIPVKWVWHFGMLHALHERLLQNQANETNGTTPSIETDSMGMAQNGSGEFDLEMALCLLTREHDALREIEAAMQRIFDGTYGICEESGEPIPAGRLQVIPWTRFKGGAPDRRGREELDLPPGSPPFSSIGECEAPVPTVAAKPQRNGALKTGIGPRQHQTVLRNGRQGAEATPRSEFETQMHPEAVVPQGWRNRPRSSIRGHHLARS